MKQSVVRLVRFGYQQDEVGDMTLDCFVQVLDAVEQVEAGERTKFVMDVSAVLASAFAKKGTNPLRDHLELLGETIRGGMSGNAAQRS